MKSVLASLLPMLGALGFFALGLRALLQADRRERAAAARYEKQAEGGRLGGAGVPSGEGPDDAPPRPAPTGDAERPAVP